VERVETAEQVFLPFVVLAELRAGFAVGTRGRENERILRRFLNKPGVEALFASEATTRAYADLYRQLRTQGTPIPTNDLWIAALVIEHELVLCSRDGHFRHLPQLNIA
jgi:tRNA(fMet)-specific endonuclease VapC